MRRGPGAQAGPREVEGDTQADETNPRPRLRSERRCRLHRAGAAWAAFGSHRAAGYACCI